MSNKVKNIPKAPNADDDDEDLNDTDEEGGQLSDGSVAVGQSLPKNATSCRCMLLTILKIQRSTGSIAAHCSTVKNSLPKSILRLKASSE